MLLLVLACLDPGSKVIEGDTSPRRPRLSVDPVGTLSGFEDLTCRGPTGTWLQWSLDGEPVAEGAGTLVVDAADTSPGTWTCTAADARTVTIELEAARPNVLFVLVDDIGIDNIAAYSIDPEAPATPTFDALAAEGIRFEQAWALSECSPTRAALMTGRYPSRTGFGTVMSRFDPHLLSLDEVTLPELLRTAGYSSALAGKWHLAAQNPAYAHHPSEQGFDRHAGTWHNLESSQLLPGTQLPLGYYLWEKNVDGELEWSLTYATIDTTDDALFAMGELPEPWFVLASYNAAHRPFHTPPPSLSPGDPATTPAESFDRMVEALDAEVGRLLAGVDRERTMIVWMSDNGTPIDVLEDPVSPEQIKGSYFEGGTRVPLVVVAPWVPDPGRVSPAMVHVVDWLPTIAAAAGVRLDDGVERDGHSLLPLLLDPAAPPVRDVLFAEKFLPNGFGPHTEEAAWVRDATHRLVVHDGVEILTRQGPGPLEESDDLLVEPLSTADAAALARLRTALADQEQRLGR